jgi:D-alanyl-D-alanine carboxypeptidase
MRNRARATAAVLFLPVLLGLGAVRAQALSPQELSDREGDQEGLTDSEVASPVELEVPAAGAPEGAAHFYDKLVRGILGAGNWGVEIALVDSNGAVYTLSGVNAEKPLIPASTMKLFTGWYGFAMTEDSRARGEEPSFPAPWISYEAYAAHALKTSDNEMAEGILKKFAPARGADKLEKFVEGLGLSGKAGFTVVDASGFSKGNRATAHLQVSLLKHIHADSEHYRDFRGMLAQPGETGTLHGRFPGLGGKLYAKTGTLTRTRVAALAGFLDMPDNGTLIFSIIGNNPRLPVETQRARIDRVVETLYDEAVSSSRAAVAAAAASRRPAVAAAFAASLAAALP